MSTVTRTNPPTTLKMSKSVLNRKNKKRNETGYDIVFEYQSDKWERQKLGQKIEPENKRRELGIYC